jgi:ribonuclease HII
MKNKGDSPEDLLKRLQGIIDNSNPRVTHIIGVDESGTGAFAGSFYASAVLTSRYWSMEGVRDSKKTSHVERQALVERLDEEVLYHAERPGTVESITRVGQAQTWVGAVANSVRDVLRYMPQNIPQERVAIVVDGVGSSALRTQLERTGVMFMFVKKADTFVPAVSAASIFAKFHRDVEMEELDNKYPQYKFGANAGYGTDEHRKAIATYGHIPLVHRPCAEDKRS